MPEQMHKSVASESAWAREFKGWLSLFHQGFFFFSAHTLSCQTLWAAGIPAYLFIYYPGALRMQPGLLFYYFILFFFYSEGDGGVLKLQQRQLLRALQGSRLGESHRPAPAKSARRQLWPFGAVCMGCIKPNDVCLVFFFFFLAIFFFFWTLINTFSCLLSDHLLLSCVCCFFSSHNGWDEWIRLIDRLASLFLT